MSFFEPAPPPEPPPERAWAPPVWDRPSEGTLPQLIALNQVMHVGADAVVALESVGVYTNGFVLNFVSAGNPRKRDDRVGILHLGGLGLRDPMSGLPRVGVRFADGRSAGRSASPDSVEKDDQGIPTQPVVHFAGGGGNGTRYQYSVWVFPLPPAGPVEVYLAVPLLGLEEGRAEIDGEAIRRAATRARPIWT